MSASGLFQLHERLAGHFGRLFEAHQAEHRGSHVGQDAVNADGTPNTAHSLNPVPIVVVSDRVKTVHDGVLADVAPTVLKLMGLEQPAEMTGKVLVELK